VQWATAEDVPQGAFLILFADVTFLVVINCYSAEGGVEGALAQAALGN
jgi:hypothetical protein